MSDYIPREDTVDAINANADDLEQNGGIPYAQGARAMAIVVEKIPPADVVPVVRCKDCRHWQRGMIGIGCYWDADYPHEENDFCSRGERKE